MNSKQEPTQSDQRNIFQSSAKNRLKLATFWRWAKGSIKTESGRPTSLHTYPFLQRKRLNQEKIWSTNPEMTTVSHSMSDGRYIEIKNYICELQDKTIQSFYNFSSRTNKTFHFYINSLRFVWTIKYRKLNFQAKKFKRYFKPPLAKPWSHIQVYLKLL